MVNEARFEKGERIIYGGDRPGEVVEVSPATVSVKLDSGREATLLLVEAAALLRKEQAS